MILLDVPCHYKGNINTALFFSTALHHYVAAYTTRLKELIPIFQALSFFSFP